MKRSLRYCSSLLLSGLLGVSTIASTAFGADEKDTVKVGVLHSLSGTMAISETSLRDVLLFAFDQINAKGGVLGKKIEPVVVDGASNWPLFAEKAKQLLEEDKVAIRLRLLDLGEPQIGSARFREGQRHAVLSRAVRG